MSDQRLSGIENTTVTADVAPYSKFIKLLQLILPLSAFAIIGILVLWPQLSRIETAPLSAQDLKALKEAETSNTLLGAHFTTQDDKGRPISIEAKKALQSQSREQEIELLSPKATFQGDDRNFAIQSDKGLYDQTQKKIFLKNNVIIKDDQNNVLETESLTANIEDGELMTHTPSRLTTPEGVIEGQGVVIDQNTQKTTFTGPAKAILNP